jgi:hypothetical protein
MGMNTKTFVIVAGAGLALYLVYTRKEKLMDKENPDFREGYTAGFLTPGPFTIIALAGLAHYS